MSIYFNTEDGLLPMISSISSRNSELDYSDKQLSKLTNCTNCGAPLKIKSRSSNTLICEYCGTEFH